jgi:hypothetical protein
VPLAFVGIDVNPQSLCHGGFLGRARVNPKGARSSCQFCHGIAASSKL